MNKSDLLVKIATISGSAREANATEKALSLVQDELSKMNRVEVLEILPRTMKLAIPGSQMDGSDRERLQEILRGVDGVILATPEYHGSFSSLMKLTIENMGFPSVLKGMPVGLLGVAGGRIGAVKSLEHLRSVCSHIGALVLPGSTSIANVGSIFDQDGNCLNPKVEGSVRKIGTRLVRYIIDTSCPQFSFEEMIRGNS